MVKLQYCRQGSAHNPSLIPVGSDGWLKVDSRVHPFKVGKVSSQFTRVEPA